MQKMRLACFVLLFCLGIGSPTSASLIGASPAQPSITASAGGRQETARADQANEGEKVCKPESESLSCKPLAVQMVAYLFYIILALAIAAALCLLLAPAPRDDL